MAFFGVASVLVPWLFLMPATGVGIFATKAPNPSFTYALALTMHIIIGFSLVLSFSS